MKKRKSILGAVLLSTVLAGNVFAGDYTTGGGFFNFFGTFTTPWFRSRLVRRAKRGNAKLADRRRAETEKEIADRLNKKGRMFSISTGGKPVYRSWLVALSCLFFACFRSTRFRAGGN